MNLMEDEIEHERKVKRRKMAERRRLEKSTEIRKVKQTARLELFIKFGIISILASIPVNFFYTMYPFIFSPTITVEVYAILYFLTYSLGILFGLGLIYAGKRMSRDTAIYGGVFQLDGAILAILNLSIYLIVNPFRYTQQELIINSLINGFTIIFSVTSLIFSIMISIFLILVGVNSQKKNLKYLLAITGIFWLASLFVPAFRPSPYQDMTLYIAFSAFTWIVYGLTAYSFWKILYDFEGVEPLKEAPFRLK